MSRRVTTAEHPLAAVFLHWVHLVSFFALAVTGFQIHLLPAAARAESSAHSAHMALMPVFIFSAALRLVWAFLGGGSAERGSDHRIGDWRHFMFRRGDAAVAVAWLRHYLTGTTAPEPAKYNPLQRTVYVVLFPLGVVGLAITGLGLDPAFSDSFQWVSDALGADSIVRTAHLSLMWLMVGLTALHVFAAFNDGFDHALVMLLHFARRQPQDQGADA